MASPAPLNAFCGVLIDKSTGHPECVYLDIQEGALQAKRGSGKTIAIVPVVNPYAEIARELAALWESNDGWIDDVRLDAALTKLLDLDAQLSTSSPSR